MASPQLNLGLLLMLVSSLVAMVMVAPSTGEQNDLMVIHLRGERIRLTAEANGSVNVYRQAEQQISNAQQSRTTTTTTVATPNLDYVASDLEYELILKKLQQLSESNVKTESDSECGICLDELKQQQEENSSELPPPSRALRLTCKHDFHLRCIEKWGATGRTMGKNCPICKAPVRLNEATLLDD